MVTIHRHSDPGWLVPQPLFLSFRTSPRAEIPTFLAGLARVLLPLTNEPLPSTLPLCPQALPFIVFGPGMCLIQVALLQRQDHR